MTKKIFKLITWATALVLILSFGAALFVLYNSIAGAGALHLDDELTLAAQGVELMGKDYLVGLEDESFRLTWIAPDGSVLYDTQAEARDMDNHLEREEIQEALSSEHGESFRYSDTLTLRMVYHARRLSDGSVLRLSTSYDSVFALLVDMLLPMGLIAFLTLALSMLLARYMARSVVQPLNELDLEHPLENQCYEEIRPLLHRINRQHREIARSEAKRQEFTANVSHELKSPLQTIIGSAELLESGLVKEEDVPRFLGHIKREAARLALLVDDILRLSRLDEGKSLPTENVELRSLAAEVGNALADSAADKSMELVCSGGDCCINGVRSYLYEMIYNLCDNAIRYNPAGTRVEIHTELKGEAALICVCDNGIGIPAEHQERIFERFYRVDKSHSRESGGTGLGLSIVKHVASYHGGEVRLESSAGKGCCFEVRLPLSQQKPFSEE